MVEMVLPFTRENKVDEHGDGFHNCEFFQTLPPPLQRVAEEHPYLFEYLHWLPIEEVGIPRYYTRLTKKMEDIKEPNIIYPLSDGIFAHVLIDDKDTRNHYIIIEPTLTMELGNAMSQVESRCIQFGDRLPDFDAEGDKKQQLTNYVEQMTALGSQPEEPSSDRRIGLLHRGGPKLTKVRLTERELDGIKYLFIRDKLGLGDIEPLVSDPYIEDIGCSGVGHLFIEHKIFKGLKSPISFSSLEDLDAFVLRLAEQIGKPVTYKTPIADATLPAGARINIVYGRDVSKRGSNFSIRKFSAVPISIFEMVDFGTINYQMLAYLSLVIPNGMNLFVAGESASGKTSMLNALTTFIPPKAKIVSIEDTPELQVPHENWIREVVQTDKQEDASGAVTTFDLLKAALRQRPNEIIVGEIRGPEGNVAFQAMQTGHAVMATFHASTMEKLIQRMTAAPILVPKSYMDNLNVAILMRSIKMPDGGTVRRITEIDEIVGYDPPTQSFNIVEAFKLDETRDTFEFTGYMNSHVMEHKIATMMGIPSRAKQRIYAEIDKRARIFAKLHKERGITGFYEVLQVLGQAQNDGLL
jgi:flagellar protein FlaI